MERLVDASLADVGRTIYRYRPVAAATVAIVVLGLALPGPRREGLDLSKYATGDPVAATSQTPIEQVAEAVTAVPESDDAGQVVAPVVPSSSGFTFESSSSSSSSFSSASKAVASPSPTTPTTSAPVAVTSPPTTAAPQPAITATLWSSAQAGTPLAAQGVPAKSLPVGSRLGRDDKRSFIKVSHAPDRLVLHAHEDASGQRTPEAAIIQVCALKSGSWKAGEAATFAEAPEADCTVAVQGARASDGSWSFDLRPLDGRLANGLAILPVSSGASDFQVAFKASLS